jgi:hypothetical protein
MYREYPPMSNVPTMSRVVGIGACVRGAAVGSTAGVPGAGLATGAPVHAEASSARRAATAQRERGAA